MKPGSKARCGVLLAIAMWNMAIGIHDLEDGQILWGVVCLLLGVLLAIAFVDELEGA